MTGETVNLIYASSSIGFFSKVKDVSGIVVKFKSSEAFNSFGPKDEAEMGRGLSYAVFPELPILVGQKQTLTFEDLRESLIFRGIVDQNFQDKLLSALLQEKLGLQFAMGTILNILLQENGHMFTLKPGYDLQLEVKSPTQVKMVFTGIWEGMTDDPKEEALQARVEIDITPDKIAIHNFQVTQLSNSAEATQAFKFLEANQTSFWQKIVTFIKTYFNINTDLDIENAADGLGVSNTKS